MGATMVTAILWFAAIGCGLMGGLYFAFSTFILRALARLDPAASAAAMNAINADILRSLFLALFLGTTLASFAAAIVGLVDPGAPGARAMLAGGLIYVSGMFVATMLCNVPLNDALAGGDGAALWARYVRGWLPWNHVRTLASTAACALYILALTQR